MKKIIYYIPALSKGGAERVMLDLARKSADKGDKVLLVTVFKAEIEYDVPDNIQRVVLGESKEILKGKECVKRLRNICIKENADLLVAFLNIYHAILATAFIKTKCIISIRNNPTTTYCSTYAKLMNRWLLPFADGCVFQTKDARESFPALKKKSVIIANPIKDSFFGIERKPIEGVLVSCGRLIKQKNQEMMIRAFEQVHRSYPTASLHIYGDGELKDYLEQLINQKKLTSCVFLEGISNDVENVLSKADIFLLSSDFEGMPNALMEAMAAGVPSISTDCPCGGPKELLNDEMLSNYLVKVNDDNALAQKIIILLKDRACLNETGRRLKQVAQKYRSDSIFEIWNSYFDKIIGDS